MIPPTIRQVQDRVCRRFNLPRLAMIERHGPRAVTRPRNIAIRLSRALTGKTLNQIGRAFGGRDHTTIIEACRRVDRLRETDRETDLTIRELAMELAPLSSVVFDPCDQLSGIFLGDQNQAGA